jgi:homoserine kinase
MSPARENSFEVRVPASTANLGAGFDCLGLALELYLSVRATVLAKPGSRSKARSRGATGTSDLPSSPDENLIFKAMRYAAEREGLKLPLARIAVQNDIPVAGGLGSSAAAIVAGVALGFALGGAEVAKDRVLRYAAEMEGHADNVGAALHGAFVVTFIRPDGNVIAVRKSWPKVVRMIVVTPDFPLETEKSRAVLPPTFSRADAVHNLQRSALFVAALDERRYDLLWDALQDRLHQDYRKKLIPGLADVIEMPRSSGFLGAALSGAGPSVIAFATDKFEEAGKNIARHFERHGISSTVRILEAAQEGLTWPHKSSPARAR